MGRLVERRRSDAGGELDIGSQVEAVGYVVEVAEQLGLGRIALAPFPLVLEFGREGIGIFLALDIDPSARITVPVPGPADPLPRLDHPRAEPEAPQAVQHVKAGKTGADDHRVEGLVRHGRAPCVLL